MTGWRLWMMAASVALATAPAHAQGGPHWVTVWTGADQGPYPAGYPAAQPVLSAAFPHPDTGSHEQTFRLTIKPDLWARQMRFRFSNAFGNRPVTFDTAFAGLQMSGAAVVAGTNRPLTFAAKKTVTVAPGAQVWSDPVALPFVHAADQPELAGRKLSVTFHVVGDSGPMTWHALAQTTSYVTAPDAGAIGELEDDSPYPYSTTSWFFVDAADAAPGGDVKLVVCLGDSITDGTDSTLNGDDRWPDVLSRRLHASSGARIAIVNQGMSGNRVLMGAGGETAVRGGPPATARLERDVLSLDGVTDVMWLEGINDLAAGASAEAVRDSMAAAVAQLRSRIKGVKVIGATLTSSRGSSLPGYGTVETDQRRHALNDLIRKPGLFDAVVDFDAATIDPATGELRPEFVPSSTMGDPGDKLHPNRPGYLAMGDAVDLRLLTPPPAPKPRPKPKPKPADDAAPADPAL